MKKFRIFSWIPAIVLLCTIFSFSAQTGEESGSLSYQISYKVMELKNNFLQEQKDPKELAQSAEEIHYYIRKLAHMTEYLLLACSFAFPLYFYHIRGIRLFFVTIILCLAAAGLDEYHQSFVDGRGPSVKDVGIDFLGALLGSGMIFTVERIVKRKR